MKNILKRCFKHLDNDQLAVIKSVLVILAVVLAPVPFFGTKVSILYFFLLMPTQLIITIWFSAKKINNLKKRKNCFVDIKTKKKFKESTAYFFCFGNFVLVVLSLFACVYFAHTPLSFLVLFLPLLITRTLIYFFKLPITVLHALLDRSSSRKTDWHKQQLEEHERYLGMGYDSKFNVGNVNHDR